jgi:hypothetical protein
MTKPIARIAVLAAAVVALGMPAPGESIAAARVDVPFQFTVGARVLPAGSYVVNVDTTGRWLELYSRELGRAVQLVSGPVFRQASPGVKGVLVFNKYGTVYCLSRFWNTGEEKGYRLPRAKVEREMASTPAAVELAFGGGGSQ